jgi:hypothetical protein
MLRDLFVAWGAIAFAVLLIGLLIGFYWMPHQARVSINGRAHLCTIDVIEAQVSCSREKRMGPSETSAETWH